MLSYVTIGVNDMARAIAFYDAAFGAIGLARETTSPRWVGYRPPGKAENIFLCPPFDGQSAIGGNGAMFAFLAPDRESVDAFHAAAMAHGGRDEGPPGVREGMNPVFYAAYVRDPDGNKLCAYVRK
jgi:catechol 2,3-dioxygenase-like lactoylglutathione lyase family enzyme